MLQNHNFPSLHPLRFTHLPSLLDPLSLSSFRKETTTKKHDKRILIKIRPTPILRLEKDTTGGKLSQDQANRSKLDLHPSSGFLKKNANSHSIQAEDDRTWLRSLQALYLPFS